MKTSAGRRSGDNDKVSRRLELVRSPQLKLTAEKSNRRFRIGLADNLFEKDVPCAEIDALGEGQKLKLAELTTTVKVSGFELSRTDVLIGLAAGAGLVLGYLIGKRRD